MTGRQQLAVALIGVLGVVAVTIATTTIGNDVIRIAAKILLRALL